jgi:peptidylprolyl isomerase/FKBP-type peptidyl-prolyl cis-trans isomerase FklB
MTSLARTLATLSLAAAMAACARHHDPAGDLKAAKTFMETTAKQPGVITLPSGLEYKVVASGPADGPHPRPADEVKVHYEGKLVSGKVFDSSFQRGEPGDFIVQSLIPAWVEALQLMRPGDEWILYVPPALGYGDQDAGPIPAGSVLIFRMRLLGVLPHPAANG